jgi:hypothetical protein
VLSDISLIYITPKVKKKEELINSLKKLTEELGHIPKRREMDNAVGYPSSSAYRKHFGSWNNALIKANLSIIYKAEYTKDELTWIFTIIITVMFYIQTNSNFFPNHEMYSPPSTKPSKKRGVN